MGKKFVLLLISVVLSLSLFISHCEEYNAILTSYCSCQHCCSWHIGKDGKPKFNLRPNVTKIIGQTASGAIARQGLTLAMPKQFPFGTHVYIDGKLLGVNEDRGGAIIMKGKVIKIDVFHNSHINALKFGKKFTKVKIVLPGENGIHNCDK